MALTNPAEVAQELDYSLVGDQQDLPQQGGALYSWDKYHLDHHYTTTKT